MEKDILVTMIVTIHNNAETLNESIDSLLAQTFKNFEVICIDGGSKDNSPLILEEYASKDSRIRIINDENTSYGHKINRGIMEAKGKYFGILESDDIMKKNMLELLVNVINHYDVDYVDGNYEAFYTVYEKARYQEIHKYTNPNSYDRLLNRDDNLVNLNDATGAIWTGLYKTSFIKENEIFLYESPGASYQDTTFRFLVNLYAQKAYHLSNYIHYYRMDNPNSSIYSQEKVFTIAKEYDYLKEQLVKRNVDEMIWKFFYSWKYQGFLWNTGRLNKQLRGKFEEYYLKELENDIKSKNIIIHGQGEPWHWILTNREEFINVINENEECGNLNVNRLTSLVEHTYNRKCIMFGCGINAQRLYQILKGADIKIICVCDNNKEKHGMKWNGINIIAVEEAINSFQNALFLIPSGKFAEEMKKQLLESNCSIDDIYIVDL